MKIKILLVSLIISTALISGGATTQPRPAAALEDCDTSEYVYSYEEYTDGVVSYRDQICHQASTGLMITTFWADGTTPESFASTPGEIASYNTHEMANVTDEAEFRLASEVATGKKWVQWLRGKADAARNAQANWAGWSQATRDTAMMEFWGTFAKELDGLADLLIVLDKGR